MAVLATAGVVALSAVARLIQDIGRWEAVLVSVVVCAYSLVQVDAFIQGRAMLTAFGRSVPADRDGEDALERKAYMVLFSAALAFGAFNLATGWWLPSSTR